MTIDELKIEPKFRDLIPKLTDAEFTQLEQNILEEGRVKEPIITWDGVIIDGHHRYYILKKHPMIPYTIEDKVFADEHEAMAWACKNQLGRRNLSINDIYYLRGQLYNELKLSEGGQENNQNAKHEKRLGDYRQVVSKGTRDRIADEYHVSGNTIEHDELFAKGVDVAESVMPGMKDTIMHGETKIPKKVVEKIPKASPDKQRKAVLALSKGDVQKAKDVLEGTKETLERYGLDDTDEDVNYTIDDLIAETSASLDSFISGIRTSAEARKDIFDDNGRAYFIEKLEQMLNEKIKEFMEEFSNE